MEFTTEETAVFFRVLGTMANADNELDNSEMFYLMEVMGDLGISLFEKDLAQILTDGQVEQILRSMSLEKKIRLCQSAWKMMQIDGRMQQREEAYYAYLLNVMDLSR